MPKDLSESQNKTKFEKEDFQQSIKKVGDTILNSPMGKTQSQENENNTQNEPHKTNTKLDETKFYQKGKYGKLEIKDSITKELYMIKGVHLISFGPIKGRLY